MIDGGQDAYVRASYPGNGTKIVEENLSDCFEWVREEFTWTSNYDKDNNLLEKPLKRPLKELDNDHLQKLIDLVGNSYTSFLFKAELNYRRELSL